jgi:hypothetical protein
VHVVGALEPTSILLPPAAPAAASTFFKFNAAGGKRLSPGAGGVSDDLRGNKP